jgi:hypothetical protein
VTLMFEAGLSLEEIGDYVGHNSAYMTDRYRHLREGHEASSGALLRLPGGSDWRNNWRIGPLSRLVEPSKAGLLSRWFWKPLKPTRHWRSPARN